MKKNKSNIIGIAAFLILSLAGMGFGQEAANTDKDKEKIKTTSVIKDIEGEVTWIGKDKIAIVYKRDLEKGGEYEILLPFSDDMTVEHKKSLSEINKGDIVHVKYEEVTDEYKEGPKINFKAKVVSFVKPAPTNSGALTSDETPLPLKGIKGE